MNYSDTYLNSIFNETNNFIDNLSFKYDNNIKELLSIIIPAFILKYDYSNKKYIFDAFNSVKIMINNTGNEIVPAYYKKAPRYVNNDLIIEEIIVIQNMNNIIDLIDSLVHEFNHAINSKRNSYI
ncbi:MAG TPA: hypothetical protein PLV83_05880, partial [Bacilli bacterium]|nr:hypothetical protein [Bacilli bacterium]